MFGICVGLLRLRLVGVGPYGFCHFEGICACGEDSAAGKGGVSLVHQLRLILSHLASESFSRREMCVLGLHNVVLPYKRSHSRSGFGPGTGTGKPHPRKRWTVIAC